MKYVDTIFKKAIIIILTMLLTLFLVHSTVWADTCKWTVKGKVFVKDNLFVNGATQVKPLKGAKVTIYASTVNSGGWRKWGTDIINSSGEYLLTVKPAESDPIGCNKKRRFKVKVKLANDYVKIMHHPVPTVWNEVIIKTGKKSGRTVNLGSYTYKSFNDSKPHTTLTDYTATKAATMFLAYQEVYKKLKSWGLEPKKAKLLYPDGPGSNDYLGYSDPACCVKIARIWFKYNDKKWQARELTHELVHQWFNKRVFTPGFAFTGKNWFGTHDFLETTELTLYEEFAEWAAYELNKEIFGITNTKNKYIYSRSGIYWAFRYATFNPSDGTATHDGTGTHYYYWAEIENMINQNNHKWLKVLYRANISVKNYLRLLTVKDWYWKDFDDDYTEAGTTEAKSNQTLIKKYDCSQLRSPMFTTKEIFKYIKKWKDKSPNNKIPTPRGIKEFYDFLATQDNTFAQYKDHFLHLGNPHYAGKEHALDFCQEKRAKKKRKP